MYFQLVKSIFDLNFSIASLSIIVLYDVLKMQRKCINNNNNNKRTVMVNNMSFNDIDDDGDDDGDDSNNNNIVIIIIIIMMMLLFRILILGLSLKKGEE